MDRREFIKGSALAAAGMGLSPGRSHAVESRPNVLLILVDQWRTSRWTPLLQTPNLDRLASQGVSFNQHFVSASPCSPSRACILTGTYTTQNLMFANCDFLEGKTQPSLNPKIPTLGHVFGRAGYQTPYRGKWHLTRGRDRNKQDPLLDYGFTGWKPPDAAFGGPPYSGAVQDPAYTRQTVRFLEDPDSHKQPWFLVCSLVNPHDICFYPGSYPQRRLRSIRSEAPPDNWNDDLSGKPGCQTEYQKFYNIIGGPMNHDDPDQWRRYLDYYMFCIEHADANLGLVLDALERSGQRENTIVAFNSDHGEMSGSHRLRAKGCFSYEEEINAPLIISAPGRVPAGVSTEALASNVDIMPTLISLAGLSGALPYMPGKDLSPVLFDPRRGSVQDHVLFHQDWELDLISNFKHPARIRCLRDREWKYSYYFKPGSDLVEHELYNLIDDPLEMVNLGNDPGYRAKRKELFERIMERERRLVEEFEI